MITSAGITFGIAVLGMLIIPGWSFSAHFIPYTFLASLLIAWGAEMRVIILGAFCALLFDFMTGAPLGVFPLSFMAAVLIMGLLQRVVTVQHVSHDTWSWQDLGISLMGGILLWAVMMAFMWGVIQLRQETAYPFGSFMAIVSNFELIMKGLLEITVFLVIQRFIYRYQQKRFQ